MDRPQLSLHPDHLHPLATGDDDRPAVREWRWRVDNGLIGNRPPADPAILARHERNAALFRERRKRARAEGDIW